MVRTNQGGSVLRFIIIGVVLAAFLIGGVYVVRQQAGSAQPQAPANQPQANQPPEKPEERQATNPPPATNTPASNENQPIPSAGVPTSNVLPQTGPVEAFGVFIALGLLIGVGLSYLRSRRPELSL